MALFTFAHSLTKALYLTLTTEVNTMLKYNQQVQQ